MASHQTSPTGFTAGSPTGSSSSSEAESLDLVNPDYDLDNRNSAEAESVDADELEEDIEELLRNTATPLREATPAAAEPQISIPMATLMTLLESPKEKANTSSPLLGIHVFGLVMHTHSITC